MITLLKNRELHKHLDLSTPAPKEKYAHEAKAAFLLKKNISPDIYDLVWNFSRPRKI